MSNSSQRTRSSSRHLNVASEARTSSRRQSRSSARQTRFSTRRQTNYCTNRETRSFTRRQLLARERRPTCTNCTWKPSCPEYSSLWRKFSSATLQPMRNRPRRLPSNNGMSDEDSDSDETPHGIQEFNSAAASFPSTPYMFNLSLIHIWRCRRSTLCRSRWSPYH